MNMLLKAAATALLSCALASAAGAAELKVFVGGAMTETVEKIGADFAKKTGNKLDYVSDTTGALQKRLAAGEKADVVVVTAAGVDAMQKENRITAAKPHRPGARAHRRRHEARRQSTRSVLDRFLQGVAAGGALGLLCRSQSRRHLGNLFRRLAQADGNRRPDEEQDRLSQSGSEVADAVAKGDAELGISFIAELAPNKGLRVAGPLPQEIQSPTDYVAAVTTVSANPDAARAFIQGDDESGGRAQSSRLPA
jgi:molybdate transport system substrate-binding protein